MKVMFQSVFPKNYYDREKDVKLFKIGDLCLTEHYEEPSQIECTPIRAKLLKFYSTD